MRYVWFGRRSTWCAARLTLSLACVAICLAAGAASASALNVTGTWTTNYHCEAGWCAGEDFPATTVLNQAEGSSVVTGSNGSETISGSLSGNTLTLRSETGGYESNAVLTVSADGLSFEGPANDNNGTSGTSTGHREATTATISGQVNDSRGQPVAGIALKLTGTSDEGNAVSKSETSNKSGSYSIEVPAGTYTITASGEAAEENGGVLGVAKNPSKGLECPGMVKEATCTIGHVAVGESLHASYYYTYCGSSERLPNGKPPTECPIIFIPGFLGSRIVCNSGELWTNIPSVDFADMRLEADGVTNAGAPGSCSKTAGPVPGQEGVVSTAAGADIYASALKFINQIENPHGYPVPEKGAYAFPYDWRKSPELTLGALDAEVDDVLSKTGAKRVVLMAHSMGGLVTQAYIANPAYAEKVVRAITLGTPYWGAPKSHTALLAAKSNEPAPEFLGLDLFLNATDLQLAARTMQGLYWLYPSANYGPWLKVEGAGYSGAMVGGSQIDPWVASLGGSPALVNSALAGHAALDGFKTNGVDYQIVVGTGVPTITSMEVAVNEFEPSQFVRVWFGSGDGTVPARSATQGAFEGAPRPLGDNVPIHYVCGVDHVSLPGNAGVQANIEGFLTKGTTVSGNEECAYTGVETEFYKIPVANKGAFAAGAGSDARVATASGALTLEQAFKQHLIQLIHNGGRSIIVTDDHHPVTLDLSGSGLALKVRSLTSAGKGVAKGSGPARYYGPVSGTITITAAGVVQRNGKTLKPVHADRRPRTVAHVTRHGHIFIVRLTAKDHSGIAAIYVRIGKGAPRVYRKPLHLTAKQLKRLRFASVDRFGTWEASKRAHVPR